MMRNVQCGTVRVQGEDYITLKQMRDSRDLF